jgi:hypothetical protein
MGFVNTEQTTAIIESVAKVVEASNPETTVVPAAEPNYWWMMWIAVLPVVILPFFLWIKKAFSKKGKKNG